MTIENKFVVAQREVLRRLEECERKIGKLYAEYAEVLPEMADFWLGLASEEERHAVQLESLQSFLGLNTLFQNLGRFDLAHFDALFARVRSNCAASRQSFDAERALSVALSLERTLLEGEFYATVQSDNKAYQLVARHLASAGREHFRRIERRLQHLRRMPGMVGPGSPLSGDLPLDDPASPPRLQPGEP